MTGLVASCAALCCNHTYPLASAFAQLESTARGRVMFLFSLGAVKLLRGASAPYEASSGGRAGSHIHR